MQKLVVFIFLFLSCSKGIKRQTDVDSTQAIRIAISELKNQYGKEIEDRKPFIATETDSVWLVEGSPPEGMLGGVPYAEITKKNGRVKNIGFYEQVASPANNHWVVSA